MIVVGAGGQMRSLSLPAKELYTGALFRAARRYAELSGHRWAIVSVEAGVVTPETLVKPGVQALPRQLDRARAWGKLAARAIEEIRARDPVGLLLGQSVEILANREIAEVLREALEAIDIESRQPLAGLPMGARLRRLRKMADALQALKNGAWEKGRENHESRQGNDRVASRRGALRIG